jgi:hypothetical protein
MTLMSGVQIVPSPEYRTQKAAGLKALRDHSLPTPPFEVFGAEHFGFESPYDRAIVTEELQGYLDKLHLLKTTSENEKNLSLKYYIDNAIAL